MKNSRKYNMIEVHFLYDQCEYNKDTANSRNKIKLKKNTSRFQVVLIIRMSIHFIF